MLKKVLRKGLVAGVHKIAQGAYVAAVVGEGVCSWVGEAIRTVAGKERDKFLLDCGEDFEMGRRK